MDGRLRSELPLDGTSGCIVMFTKQFKMKLGLFMCLVTDRLFEFQTTQYEGLNAPISFGVACVRRSEEFG